MKKDRSRSPQAQSAGRMIKFTFASALTLTVLTSSELLAFNTGLNIESEPGFGIPWERSTSTRSMETSVEHLDGVADTTNYRLGPTNGTLGSPDITAIRLRQWVPVSQTDLFQGHEDSNFEDYFRIDVEFEGFVSPPGPRGLSGYDPEKYGTNPVYAFIEFDVDQNCTTGGDLEPWLSATNLIGRMGGVVQDSRMCLGGITNPELYKGSDNEYYPYNPNDPFGPSARFNGIDFVFKIDSLFDDADFNEIQAVGSNPLLFEPGETVELTGEFFCRSQAQEYPPFWLMADARYCPELKIRFSHDISLNRTTVSLVFPLNNHIEPGIHDNDTTVDYSLVEAFNTIKNQAALIGYPMHPIHDPYQSVFYDWSFAGLNQMPDAFNAVAYWDVFAVAMTAATGLVNPLNTDGITDPQLLVLTDTFPNITPKDLDGNGSVDQAEYEQGTVTYVQERDGVWGLDADGIANGCVTIPDFPFNFSIYDEDYDGRVGSACLYPPQTPQNLRVIATDYKWIRLAWDFASSADYYQLKRLPSAVYTLDDDEYPFTVTGLAARTTYSFQIRACNSMGCSEYSPIVQGTTRGGFRTLFPFNMQYSPLQGMQLDECATFIQGENCN